MRRDEAEACRYAARAEVESDVLAVLDELTGEHDGDWPTLNALDLVRSRLAVLFGAPGDDEE